MPDALAPFERALPALEKSAANDPTGMVEILDDYQAALMKSNKPTDAAGIGKRAETVRATNPGKSATMIKPP